MLDTLWRTARQEVWPRLSLGHAAAFLLLSAGAFANFKYGQSLAEQGTDKIVAGGAAIGADLYNAIGLILVFAMLESRRYVHAAAAALVFVITIAFSINAGLSFSTVAKDRVTAERVDAASTKAELAKLPTVRSPGTIKAEMDKILADPRAGDCSKIDGKYTREHCPRYFELKGEHETALEVTNKRDRLLSITSQKVSSNLSITDPFVTERTIKSYLELVGVSASVETINRWQSLIFVLLVVIGGPVALWLSESVIRKPDKEPDTIAAKIVAKPVEATTKKTAEKPSEPPSAPPVVSEPKPKRKPQTAKIEAENDNVLGETEAKILHRVNQTGVVIAASQNDMARVLDVSRTSMRRALDRLCDYGLVNVSSHDGYRVMATAVAA